MMESSGLLDHWHSVYWTPPNRCTVVRQEQPRTPILSLSNLAGAFILFVSGFFISALAYVIELISSAYQKKKN